MNKKESSNILGLGAAALPQTPININLVKPYSDLNKAMKNTPTSVQIFKNINAASAG